MSRKRAIIKGTFILTITGFATRFMGFFYRIFLSHTFGEEGVGLYQLVFPIYALCFSLTSAGIQLALSRCVARCMTQGKKKEARELLCTSLVLTVAVSCIVTVILQKYSVFIADTFLKDARCAQLLVILSYAFPFASIHSCICGYYFGLKQTGIPATSQMIEQIARILSVYLIYIYGLRHGVRFGVSIAVAGLIAGEILWEMAQNTPLLLHEAWARADSAVHPADRKPGTIKSPSKHRGNLHPPEAPDLWNVGCRGAEHLRGSDRNGPPLHTLPFRDHQFRIHHAASRGG